MMNSEPSSSSDALHRHYSRTSRAQGHVAIDATLVVRRIIRWLSISLTFNLHTSIRRKTERI